MFTWNALYGAAEILLCGALAAIPLNAQSKKIQAQNLVQVTAHNHSEIASLEISAIPEGQKQCVTIAATEAKDVGEKCDADEETALKTQEPFVEQEADGFDVTAPLHDAKGKLIGTVGIDFKPQQGQTKKEIVEQTDKLLKEIEPQIPSKAFLFQSAS